MSATTVKSAQVVRWRIPIVLAVTVFVKYLDRNNLALALPRIARDFGWSDRLVGAHGEWLLGAFFLSYALSNMLLSPLAERFRPKRLIPGSIVAVTGSFDAAIFSIVAGALLAAFVMLALARALRY